MVLDFRISVATACPFAATLVFLGAYCFVNFTAALAPCLRHIPSRCRHDPSVPLKPVYIDTEWNDTVYISTINSTRLF